MVLKEYLKRIADAIRAKKGTTEAINAQDFVNEINDIEYLGDYLDSTIKEEPTTEVINFNIFDRNLRKIPFSFLQNSGNCTNFDYLFSNIRGIEELIINETDLDMSNGITAEYMFKDNKAKKIILNNLNMGKVISFYDMFNNCDKALEISINNCNTESLEKMRYMFYGCDDVITINLKNFNTNNVTDMSSIFYSCFRLKNLDISSFNTSKVTTMESMFDRCWALTELDLSHFNTSKVTNMGSMFYSCKKLTSLDISSFNTSNVTEMDYMFDGCASLLNIDLSNFDTSKVKYIGGLFSGCKVLETVNGIIDMQSATSLNYMFSTCPNLVNVKIKNLNYTNLSLTDCNKISHDSLMYLINNAMKQTSAKTIKLGTTNLAKLTTAEKAIATNKGWTLS